jgi:hypothetical protein
MLNYNEYGITYPIYYQSEFDFKTFNDDKLSYLLSISTLDSGLIRDLHAYGDTKYNIPFFKNIGTNSSPIWEEDGVTWILHNGIKLLYNANFVSSASEETPLIYNSADGRRLNGWNKGSGYGSGDGYHIIPAMAQYNIVQNNGTTTFIGNDILQPFLLLNNQTPGAANFASENTFDGINHSRPYTNQNYSLKNLLPINSGLTFGQFGISLVVSGSFGPTVVRGGIETNFTLDAYPDGTGYYISFVLFEIAEILL